MLRKRKKGAKEQDERALCRSHPLQDTSGAKLYGLVPGTSTRDLSSGSSHTATSLSRALTDTV